MDEAKARLAKNKLQAFFKKNNIEETTLIVDGPGVACLGVNLAPIVLGYENILKFKEVHTFSAGSFTLFWLRAFHIGLQDPNVDFQNFYRWNQKQHGLKWGVLSGAMRFLVQKILLRKSALYDQRYFYRANAVHYPFGEAMKGLTASSLPTNWHIWSYDLVTQAFINLGNRKDLSSMPVDSIIEGTTAMPGVYDAHKWGELELVDCVFTPKFKRFARRILAGARPLVFCSMTRDKEGDEALYLKAHSSGTAAQRVNGDLIRFFGGFGHPEYSQNLKFIERNARNPPLDLDA